MGSLPRLEVLAAVAGELELVGLVGLAGARIPGLLVLVAGLAVASELEAGIRLVAGLAAGRGESGGWGGGGGGRRGLPVADSARGSFRFAPAGGLSESDFPILIRRLFLVCR